MGRLSQLVVDCRHPASLARFWAAALDQFEILAYDAAEVARLAALGLTPETDPCVIVVGPDLELCFQQIAVPDAAKKPMHMDLSSRDRDAEVARFIALGATIRERFDDHTWMTDPEGNDFCVTDENTRHGSSVPT